MSSSSGGCARTSRPGGSRPGAALPSTRGLAAALGVSRGVVTEAYGQLASEGYLAMRQGAPVRVAAAVQRQRPREPARSLLPASPTTCAPACPTSRASRPTRGCARSAPPCGRRRSRRSASPTRAACPSCARRSPAQLARVRGAAADPEHVIVCGGFRAGFSALCRWLRGAGRRARRGRGSGLASAPARDRAGRPRGRAGAGRRAGAARRRAGRRRRVVVVTPGHQFPTGAVLSRERRAALVEWAAANEAPDRRGRLRQRAVRPAPGRAAGARAGARRADRLGQQAARARAEARLDVDAFVAHVGDHLRPRDRGRRRRRDRPARAARLRRARRARAPPAPDALPLRGAARDAARRAAPASRELRVRDTPPAGLFVLADLPDSATRARSSRAPPRPASASRASACTASSPAAAAGSCSATARCRSRRSSAPSTCSPACADVAPHVPRQRDMCKQDDSWAMDQAETVPRGEPQWP